MLRAVRLILPAFCLLGLPVQAAVFTVTKTADTLDGVCDRDCSLREAVSAANLGVPTDDADVVVIPAGVYQLTRLGAGEDFNNSGDLDINRPMILVGAGAGSTVLSGGGFDRVLDVRAPAEVFGVTIRQGRVDGDGGGILIRPGAQVVLQRSVVTGNLAETVGNGGDGGGIAAFGFLEVNESAILENQAEGDGGGIGAGLDGSFKLTNVTISGNVAAGSGGGLDYEADIAGTISGSTIVFNQAQISGGGISVGGVGLPGPYERVFGSIVAENLAPAGRDCIGAEQVSLGYNVFGVGEGCGARLTDRAGTAQSPLQVVFRLPRTDLGPTPVHELLPNSPALGLVPAQFCEPGDQVGQARKPPCDAGAWEKVDRPVCVPGGSVLCLQGGRFRASALWTLDERFPGNPATAFPLTDDTGVHWFFGPDNLEVMTKVLDGCGLSGHWWVFTSGLTDVGVTLRIEDLKTGNVWEHVQPRGQVYAPRLDTGALPCDLPDQSAAAPTGAIADDPILPPPLARVLLVTKTTDSDDGACNHDCSLREAVLEANLRGGTGVVVIVAGPGVHTLSLLGGNEDLGHTGDLDVTGELVILGAGADRTTFDGNDLDRVLDVVHPAGILELHGATVSGGWARNDSSGPGSGGGIRSSSFLALVRSIVRSNRAEYEGGGLGTSGPLTVRDSTVSGNVAGASGGGIAARMADLENVTISGNEAALVGGGFLWYGPAALRNVTITGNTALAGGGIATHHCQILCPPIPFEMQRTVIAGNAGLSAVGGGPFDDCDGPPHTGGEFNVLGSSCTPGPNDVSGTPAQPLDPRLTPLGDHGGPTPTHALLPDSPAIDLAPSCAGGDQRGRPRPADGDGDGAALCDAGAVERLPGCQPDAETLCLGAEDRFRVTARWTTGGNTGPGKALPLAAHTGSFRFFDPANVELTVKVLDGCGLNDRFWVFLSGLTDVGVEVTVEDTATGNTWTHNHAAGTPLQPRLDTNALSCVNL
jgi:CSLREA domain-containing protein